MDETYTVQGIAKYRNMVSCHGDSFVLRMVRQFPRVTDPLGAGNETHPRNRALSLVLLSFYGIRKAWTNTFAFSVLRALPNLQSLYAYYTATGTYAPLKPFTASLRHLDVATSVPTKALAEPLWSWILQLVPRCSLESLQIQTVSIFEVPSDFTRKLAKLHGATLKRFSVGSMVMSASDIAHLCMSCSGLEYIVCATNSKADDVGHAISVAGKLRRLNITAVFYGSQSNQYIDEAQAKSWMMRADSRLRTIQIDRVKYTGQWVLSSDLTVCFEVTCSAHHHTWG